MKKGYKILLIFVVVVLLYYVLSLLIMNNNPHVLHYYGYENFEEAKQKRGVVNANVTYTLNGFTKEQEDIIRNNIIIYTTKSNYEEFFGFLIKFEHEDKEMIRVNIELKNEEGYEKIFDGEIRYKDKYKGLIYGAQFDVFRDKKSIPLEVIEYQNNQPVKLGEIIVDLK